MIKKMLCWIIGSLFVVGLLTACSDKDSDLKDLTEVKVGDLRSEFWLPIYVAKELGYFQQQGLDIELIQFKDGPVELQSALNGEIDFAVLSVEPVLIAYDKGLKSTMLMATLKNKPFMLVANKDIHSMKELTGKIIAAGTPGSSPYAFVRSILKKYGIDPDKDVQLINMDYGASLVALTKNQIQATVLDSTRINQANIGDVNVLLDTTDPKTHQQIYGTTRYESTVVVASNAFITKHEQTTQHFINAMLSAIQWQQNHTDKEIAQLVAQYFPNLDMEDIIKLTRSSLSTDGLISKEGYKAMQQFAMTEGLIKHPIPYNELIDLSFIKQAQSKGK